MPRQESPLGGRAAAPPHTRCGTAASPSTRARRMVKSVRDDRLLRGRTTDRRSGPGDVHCLHVTRMGDVTGRASSASRAGSDRLRHHDARQPSARLLVGPDSSMSGRSCRPRHGRVSAGGPRGRTADCTRSDAIGPSARPDWPVRASRSGGEARPSGGLARPDVAPTARGPPHCARDRLGFVRAAGLEPAEPRLPTRRGADSLVRSLGLLSLDRRPWRARWNPLASTLSPPLHPRHGCRAGTAVAVGARARAQIRHRSSP